MKKKYQKPILEIISLEARETIADDITPDLGVDESFTWGGGDDWDDFSLRRQIALGEEEAPR